LGDGAGARFVRICAICADPAGTRLIRVRIVGILHPCSVE
jgi:hypothetical protein